MSSSEEMTTDEPDQAAFDFDEWLAGASLPARTVTLFRDSGLRAEYDELEQRFVALQALVNREHEAELGGGAASSEQKVAASLTEQYEVALAMQGLIARMQQHQVRVRVRACSGDEIEEIRKKYPDFEDEEKRIMACVHTGGSIEGVELSRKQWRSLRNSVGERQFADVVRATLEVNGFGDASPAELPEFPAAAAALLATKAGAGAGA